MILKPYPEYKESGVELLGDIPSHWTLPPVVELVRVLTSTVDKKTYENEIPVQLCNYTDVYYRDLIYSSKGYMRATASQEQIDAYSVRVGDVPFTKDSESADDIGISAYVEQDLPGVVYGYHLSIYRPYDIRYGKYLKWLLDSKYVKATFETRTPGVTRVGLSRNTIRYIRVPTPPALEASKIADYLDRETAEIDAFIADQEELITLLTERRTATISHAVTKGLNPNAPMKDSGVEWLGQIPAAWDVVNARRLFVQRKESARIGDQQLAATQEFGVIPQATYTELTGNRVVEVLKGFEILKHVEPGDFVISMRSFQGGLEFSEYVGKISSAYVMLKPSRELSSTYFQYLFKSSLYISALRSTSNLVRDGQAMRYSNFAQVQIPRPPLVDQAAIAAFLAQEIAEIDITIADAREAIVLSKERRAALISAAVTGKIDVRGHEGVG